ncbi:hypothetical protein [Acetobacter okinawensis]|nr:hypothetical protein [Acetobacter okinawensis]
MDGSSFLLSDKVHTRNEPVMANGVQFGCGESLKQFYAGREGILLRPAIPDINEWLPQACGRAFVTKGKIAVAAKLPYSIVL